MLKNLYTTTLLAIVLAASTRVTAQHFSMARVAIAQDTLCVKTDMTLLTLYTRNLQNILPLAQTASTYSTSAEVMCKQVIFLADCATM